MMLINLLPITQDEKKLIKATCSPGSRKKVLYKYEFDTAYGCPRRVPSGEMDLQDYIQQSADDVDFKAIGKMLVDTRDNVISHFDLNGEVMDVTKMPRSIQEYEAIHNNMLKEFDAIDPGIKSLFGNDFEQFAKAWRNGSLPTILDNYQKAQTTAQQFNESEDNK